MNFVDIDYFLYFARNYIFLSGSLWLQQKAMQWHPDKNLGKTTEKEATAKFQKISAAYKILTEASQVVITSALACGPASADRVTNRATVRFPIFPDPAAYGCRRRGCPPRPRAPSKSCRSLIPRAGLHVQGPDGEDDDDNEDDQEEFDFEFEFNGGGGGNGFGLSPGACARCRRVYYAHTPW